MEKILRALRPFLPFLAAAEFQIRNIDPDSEGLDDKAAAALRTFLDFAGAAQALEPPSTAARGLAQISAFCSAALNSLAVLRDSELPKADKIEQAQTIIDSLSDPAKVYQAQRGADAAVLIESKSQAQTILRAIIDTPEATTSEVTE